MFYCRGAWEHIFVVSTEKFQDGGSIPWWPRSDPTSWVSLFLELFLIQSFIIYLSWNFLCVCVTKAILTFLFSESYQVLPIQFMPKLIYLDKILNDKKEALPLSRFLKYGFLRNDLHWGYILCIQRAESLINYIQCGSWKIHTR